MSSTEQKKDALVTEIVAVHSRFRALVERAEHHASVERYDRIMRDYLHRERDECAALVEGAWRTVEKAKTLKALQALLHQAKLGLGRFEEYTVEAMSLPREGGRAAGFLSRAGRAETITGMRRTLGRSSGFAHTVNVKLDPATGSYYLEGVADYRGEPNTVLPRIKDAKQMHDRLYDVFQTSEALGKLSREGRILFRTPFGDFPTASFHVIGPEGVAKLRANVPANLERARCANYAADRIFQRFEGHPAPLKVSEYKAGGELAGMLFSYLYDAREAITYAEAGDGDVTEVRREYRRILDGLRRIGVKLDL